MDSSPTQYSQTSQEVEAWSSHVASSPTPVPTVASDFAFDLNSVHQQTAKSLPNFQFPGGPRISQNFSKCPCSPECRQACCRAAARVTTHDSNVERPLLSPVQGENDDRSGSPASYGSLDSNEPLIANHEIVSVRQ